MHTKQNFVSEVVMIAKMSTIIIITSSNWYHDVFEVEDTKVGKANRETEN